MNNEEQGKIGIEKLCRSCMCSNPEMRNVFEVSESLEGQSLKLAEMLMACASVQISSDDGLPISLCITCEAKLYTAFEFKKLCEKSDSTLRELRSRSLPKHSIKTESAEVAAQLDEDDDILEESGGDFNVENSSEEEVPLPKDVKEETASVYPCNYCGKVLFSQKRLSVHELQHGGNAQSCPLCSAKYPLTKQLKHHMKTVHNTTLYCYLCKECGMAFSNTGSLEKHKMEHKNEKCFESKNSKKCKSKEAVVSNEDSDSDIKKKKKRKLLLCEYCDRKFIYRKSFLHHINSEHGVENNSDDSDLPLSSYVQQKQTLQDSPVQDDIENVKTECVLEADALAEVKNVESLNMPKTKKKIHTCHVCDSKFARSNHLSRHMVFHKSVLVHQCSDCEKSFATVEHLEKHKLEVHEAKVFKCSVCEKVFTKGETFIRHLKVHSQIDVKNEMVLNCSICELTFDSLEQLSKHAKIHLEKKKHVCTECGKSFSRVDNLRSHEKTHNGFTEPAPLHLCIYCGKEFNNSSNMIVHMRRHTGERPYQCEECGKGFPRSHDLKCHERTHSGEKPYLCTLCGKSFNKSNKLLRHTRVHTGERPYVCNICGRGFTQSNDLSLHMRRHTGLRPYVCGLCPARFIQSGLLKAHRRSTGHWMETQPELKGGYRVEPVTPVSNPTPIRFKKHGKKRKEEEVEQPERDETMKVEGERFNGDCVEQMEVYKPVRYGLPVEQVEPVETVEIKNGNLMETYSLPVQTVQIGNERLLGRYNLPVEQVEPVETVEIANGKLLGRYNNATLMEMASVVISEEDQGDQEQIREEVIEDGYTMGADECTQTDVEAEVTEETVAEIPEVVPYQPAAIYTQITYNYPTYS